MPPTSPRQAITTLSPEQFLCRRPEHRPLLIDVRTRLEYFSGHAPGSVNLSLDRLLLGTIPGLRWIWPQWLRDMSSDCSLAVICFTAHRSPIAAQALTRCGFSEIFNISGGMITWQQLDFPIHTGWDP